MEASDRELVRRTLAGEAEALGLLHRRYYARVYRLALFRCKSVADAEDIAAETFVKAIDHLPAFRFQGESLFPWLSRIATNLAIDQSRRQASVPTLSFDQKTTEELHSFLETLASDGPDPGALAERHELQLLLREAIARLPGDQGDAILMRYGGDLSLLEIGAAMGRSEGAIKSLLHRGLSNLRKELLFQAEQSAATETLRQHLHSNPIETPRHVHGYIEL